MKSFLRWIPALVWMAVIFYLSSRTGGEITAMFPYFPSLNWGHFVAYFILAMAFWFALQSYSMKEWKRKGLTVLLCLIYGITDEWHQYYVPGRHPDPMDVINDTIGACLAMLVIYLWQKYKKQV